MSIRGMTLGAVLVMVSAMLYGMPAWASTGFYLGSVDKNPETEEYFGLFGSGNHLVSFGTHTCSGTFFPVNPGSCADYQFYDPGTPYTGPVFSVQDNYSNTNSVGDTYSGLFTVGLGSSNTSYVSPFIAYGVTAHLTGTTTRDARLAVFTNEHMTVMPPLACRPPPAPCPQLGDPGTMSLAYTLDGIVAWSGTADPSLTDFAEVRFSVFKDVSQYVDSSDNPVAGVKGAQFGYADPFGGMSLRPRIGTGSDWHYLGPQSEGPFNYTLQTPSFSFIYGEKFNIFTRFDISARMDNQCGGVYGIPDIWYGSCQNGQISDIAVDASNTVKLLAIIIPDDPDAQVAGLSGVDYTAYVRTELPTTGDGDGDGVLDASDNCPAVANADQTNSDGDSEGDACDSDDDNDGVDDPLDNCPFTANTSQSDLDGDGDGDACDTDQDGDGILNDQDNCPVDPNPGQADTDGDGGGDACDTDDDNDGVADVSDNCPVTANAGQADLDGDNIGDACDIDVDGDGINNDIDNCPVDSNPGQDDTDHDGDGDACDPDNDNDGVPDTADNCPLIENVDQADLDGDGQGDPCDGDLDGDGVDNDVDNCPVDPNSSQHDYDGDGQGDVCDPDVDGDGTDNSADLCAGTMIGAIVDPGTGCSIAQLCPCGGPRGSTESWRNHGKFVSCTARTAESFVDLGLITDEDKDAIVSVAGQSGCGDR